MYSNETICNILQYIEQNLFDKISIDELANNFYLNRYYLMKLFKKEIGISIINYINALRINHSLNDFKNNSILSISLMNGFYSQEYFSEIFKKVIGVSPIKYKKYLVNPNYLSKKEYDIVTTAIINLKEIIDKKESYINNRIPKESITKFPSLFTFK